MNIETAKVTKDNFLLIDFRVNNPFLSKGVFYGVYAMDLEDTKTKEKVVKKGGGNRG